MAYSPAQLSYLTELGMAPDASDATSKPKGSGEQEKGVKHEKGVRRLFRLPTPGFSGLFNRNADRS